MAASIKRQLQKELLKMMRGKTSPDPGKLRAARILAELCGKKIVVAEEKEPLSVVPIPAASPLDNLT